MPPGATGSAPTQADRPVLNSGADLQTATAGYYSLSWSVSADPDTEHESDPIIFELVESDDPHFSDQTIRYRGPDLATSISGKPDGAYFYRVRRVESVTGGGAQWSNVHQVVVAHHPLGRALTFLVIGGLVFAATFALIIRGSRSEANEATQESR